MYGGSRSAAPRAYRRAEDEMAGELYLVQAHHYACWDPDGDAMAYIRALIEAIRARVVEAKGDPR